MRIGILSLNPGHNYSGILQSYALKLVLERMGHERLCKINWMGTYGKLEDISAVVNFLCKEEASFVTGQNIAADGGRCLGLKEY